MSLLYFVILFLKTKQKAIKPLRRVYVNFAAVTVAIYGIMVNDAT